MEQYYKELLQGFERDLNSIENVNALDIVLYGSTMSGDYIKGRGDIDFLVFLEEKVTEKQRNRIFSLHEKYRRNDNMFAQLEGTYYVFDKSKKLINGVYIGTSRKGWKVIDTVIHGDIEQGMILSNYDTLNSVINLEDYFSANWKKIKNEISKLLKNFIKLKDELKDIEFHIYAILTTARNIFTLREKGFTSKSRAIDYIMATGNFDDSMDLLRQLKVIRYPYRKEELETLRFEDLDEILTELLQELHLAMQNTSVAQD